MPGHLLLVVLPLLAACNSASEPEANLEERLAHAEARWIATRPLLYTMEQLRSCECASESDGPVELTVMTVTMGSQPPVMAPTEYVVEGRYLADGAYIPSGHAFLTVQQLFALARTALEQGAHRVDVEFETAYGYPARLSIDFAAGMVDDGVAYHTASLRPVSVEPHGGQ